MVKTYKINGVVYDDKTWTRLRLGGWSRYQLKLMLAAGMPAPLRFGSREYFNRRAVDAWMADQIANAARQTVKTQLNAVSGTLLSSSVQYYDDTTDTDTASAPHAGPSVPHAV